MDVDDDDAVDDDNELVIAFVDLLVVVEADDLEKYCSACWYRVLAAVTSC